jgi:hypothetical protein
MSDELVTWLRREIEGRRALALNAVTVEADVHAGAVTVPAGPPAASSAWREQSSGVLVTSEGREDDAWYGTWAMGDSRLTRLIAANDPRDTIARCEAELAILDLHASNDYERYPECVHCAVEAFPCRTVRYPGYGYRHRPGWREEWKP